MATLPRTAHAEDEESYFISMTDVVIGLLFIFIIMLMFFAMRFQEATHRQQEVTQKQDALINDLTDAEITRSNILEEISSLLNKEGISVTIVKDEGILRLPEELLFEPSKWEIIAVDRIKALARALDQVLPCYTTGERSKRAGCPRTKAKIEAIFIEGHADPTPYRNPNAGILPVPKRPGSKADPNLVLGENRGLANLPPKDNLDLSALRATSTFRELLKAEPELKKYLSLNQAPVLSVSGYGEYRPVAAEPGDTRERSLQRHRRIDLRILMATPRSETAKQMQQDLLRHEAQQ